MKLLIKSKRLVTIVLLQVFLSTLLGRRIKLKDSKTLISNSTTFMQLFNWMTITDFYIVCGVERRHDFRRVYTN